MTTAMQPGSRLKSFTIKPVNTAAQSKGSIHDDEKAREMGYAGGFVPGTTVLGLMSRLMHESFGDSWLQSASFNGRLRRPVYEGAEVRVEGVVTSGPDADGIVGVDLRVVDADGAVLAEAKASCRAGRL